MTEFQAAERYKQKYLNRRTFPAPPPSTTFAAATTAHKARARTQSLGSASSASTATSTAEPQRPQASQYHYHKRTPSNPTLPAVRLGFSLHLNPIILIPPYF
jgi:hypothetical protein